MARVLVVDDEPDIRELVRINLELDGHDVSTAANGVEALDAVRATAPDLVVLDVMMPDLDGWQVLTQLKAEPDVSAIPVVMLTARSADVDRIRGGIEGAIRYITKPFSLADLRDEVERALSGEDEPTRRKQVQRKALEQLARLERGGSPAEAAASSAPRPHLTRLEGPVVASGPARRQPPRLRDEELATLSAKQREVLSVVASNSTVQAAALQLSVSRSNLYASLRRIARKLGVPTVPELLTLARSGGVSSS